MTSGISLVVPFTNGAIGGAPAVATGGAIGGAPQETTFKAEWHRLVWPPHARPLSAAGAWAEAGGAVESRWGRWGCGVQPWGVLKSWGSPIAGGFYHGKYWNILFKWMNIMVVSILKWSNDNDNWPYADQIVTTEWLGKSPS